MRFTRIVIGMLCMTIFSTAFALGATGEKRINLNQANAKELIHVSGLSKYKAHAIVAYRKKHGQFKSLEELRQVRGFKRLKKEKMQSISKQLFV